MKKTILALALALAAGALSARDVRVYNYADLPSPGEVPPPAVQYPSYPIAIGLLPGATLPGRNADVDFLRLNILAGAHNNVTGIDLGILGNIVDGEMYGLEIGTLFNRAKYLSGVQIGLVNYAGSGEGLQIGLVNIADQITGLQLGLGNCIRDSKVRFFPILNFLF